MAAMVLIHFPQLFVIAYVGGLGKQLLRLCHGWEIASRETLGIWKVIYAINSIKPCK